MIERKTVSQCTSSDYCKGWNDAVDAMPGWISVKEQTPQIGDLVLVVANGKPRKKLSLYDAVLIASFWGEEGWIADGFEGWDKFEVSYWMDLPREPRRYT